MSDIRDRMEGIGDALTRKILFKASMPKKVRKRGEEMGARAAASPEGQALLKKGGVLTLPTRIAAPLKVRMMDLKKKLSRKKSDS